MPTEPRRDGTAGADAPRQATRLLQRAAGNYARGDLDGAERGCRQLLQLHPDQPDALHILGLVAWRRGNRRQAVEEIRKAIAGDVGKPQPHNSLGVLLREEGDIGGAEAALRRAIELQPNYAEALTNLGNVLSETDRVAEAVSIHRRVVALAPHYADGHNNLATALARQECWEAAVDACRVAVGLDPARAEFQLNLGNALSATKAWDEAAAAFQRAADLAPGNADAHANLGLSLYYMDQPERASRALRAAAELRPDGAQIWINLGAAQVALGDADAALESCRKARDLEPGSAQAYACLGSALQAKGEPVAAIEAYETAIRLRPDDPRAHGNLGNALQAQGRFDDALAAYARAVALDPEYKEAQCNKGLLHLLLGDFGPGWRGYEHGLEMKRPRVRGRRQDLPLWDGAPVAGKTIAITGEQGIGDQIMFASLLPDLVERGANCVVDLDNRLYPLLRRSMPWLTLIPRDGAAIAADCWAPIGSLCRWLRPDLASFPYRPGFLKADPAQVNELRRRYRDRFGERPLIGISWRGGTREVARIRSIPLASWSPILGLGRCGYVSLQYGDCEADLAAARGALGVDVFRDEQVDPLENLDDFAAQTAAMDLVISIDNATVHMAGALNVPVWVLLPAVPDWRWMLNRDDSPWYPSARLFRQLGLGDWPPVIAAVAQALRHRVGG